MSGETLQALSRYLKGRGWEKFPPGGSLEPSLKTRSEVPRVGEGRSSIHPLINCS